MSLAYHFKLIDDDSLVLVDVDIQDLPFTFALDTGATHTVIDLSKAN